MHPLEHHVITDFGEVIACGVTRYEADKALFAANERASIYELALDGSRRVVMDNYGVFPLDSEVQDVVESMKTLSESDRMEVMGHFCKSCGVDNPACQCWNDE